MSSISQGFVYVATGEGYVAEAQASALSLREAMPSASICLITDIEIPNDPLFDTIIRRSDAQRSPVDKLLAVHCPYERAVFLDTDTTVVGGLMEIFDALERFDLALLPETKRGWDYELPGVPLTFSEYNTGVIGFQNSPRVKALFIDWAARYARLREKPGLINDQPALREAIWHSDIRVAPLPSEYHFLGNVPNYIMWRALLIHARGDRAGIAASVNRVLGPRAFVPDVGVVPGFHGKRSWLGEMARVLSGMSRLLVRPPTRSAEMNPGQWWTAERRQSDDA